MVITTAELHVGPTVGRAVPRYSIVVPLHNEEASIPTLHSRIVEVMQDLYEPFEMVFVDDCSHDASPGLLDAIAARDARVTVVHLKRNYGQTAALAAGFDYARGEIIVSMDGDLQHDPADTPILLAKLDEGYDLVSGWRKQRIDNFMMRRLPSRIANWLMTKLSGVELHDFGTTFKAYRRETIRQVRLYGEMHRFIPALASWNGARIAEVPIKNLLRENSASHYGISRTFQVLFDLLTIRFLLKYVTKPLHFFGPLGLVGIGVGGLIGIFLFIRKLTGVHIFTEHGPLLILAAMLFLAGVQLLSIGLVAELLARTYFESNEKPIYTVARIVRSTATP